MHVAAHLLPGHHKARPVGAEHRVRRVVQIMLRLVAHGLDDFLRIVAGAVALQRQAHAATATGVADHLHGITAHGGGGGFARQGGCLAVGAGLRRVKATLHPLDVIHGTAQVLGRDFQPERIPGLQQLCFADLIGHHQALPHRAVSRLPEVTALGVLEVGPARNEGNFYIRQRCPDENTQVLFFFQMGQHQPLPVFVQHFFPAVGGKLHPAAGGQGFQLEVHLGIVAEGLVVAHALHGLGDGLLI